MSYPGNDALAQETKDRLLRTFSQTLDLAARGGVQEALLGCDFILRMDPLFQPARTLHERLSSATGSVDVDDLRGVVGGVPAAAPASSYGTVQMPAIKAPQPARPTVDPQAVRNALQRAFDARDFAGVVALATQQRTVVEADPSLEALVQAAQSHAEAEPYVRRFLDEARNAVQQGNPADAERLLQKVASLDATHPELEELRQLAAAAARSEEPLTFGDLPADLSLADAPNELSFADLNTPELPTPPARFEIPGTLGSDSPDPESLDIESLDIGALDADSLDTGALAPGGTGPVDGGVMGAFELPEPLTPQRAPEGDSRIGELLDEGQASLERGEYQAAIDAWSRIFLIDIDHGEAARRIEQARKLKAEAERQAEEIFHEGVAKFESADPDGARACFERLLEQQPNHLAAREYLDQIEAGKVRVAPRPAGLAAKLPPSGAHAAPPAVLKEEILVPPEPGQAPAKPAKAATVPSAGVRKSRSGRTFALVGLVVLLVAGGGGWYLFTHRSRFFPNSEPPAPATAPQQDAIQRATALHGQGKTAVAIAQLRRVPQDDPLYEKAQALIAQWQAAAEQPPPAAAPAPEVQAKQTQLVADARAAYGQGSYLKAQALFEQAAAGGTLEGSAAELLADCRKQTATLQNELAFLQQGEYEVALRNLWRLHEAQRANRDVITLMVRAYYNLGIKDLQREAPSDALQNFKEALGLDSSDAEVLRLARFAEAYASRTQDLQYRIFVKYLTAR